MAKLIRSIDRIAVVRGQLRLALFFAAWPGFAAHGQMHLEAGLEQFASAGFIKPAHWLDERPSENDRTHWLTQRTAASAHYQFDNWRLGISREKQAYARANTGALSLAAQDKANHEVDLSTPGNFPLHAEIWKLGTTTFSAAYAWKPGTGVSLELEPFVQTIHDFEHMRGDLLLVNNSGSSRLSGQISKTGTRSYGFLPNDQPDQGWGSGVNLRASWESPMGRLSLTVHNAWNRQEFSAVHQTNLHYNVSSTGNKINIADLPSVTGEYGLTQGRTKLPAFWQSAYEPAMLPGLTVGAMGLGKNGIWTAGYYGTWAGGRWWVRTAQTSNWSAGYGYAWASGWKASLGVSANAYGKAPVLSSIMVGKSW